MNFEDSNYVADKRINNRILSNRLHTERSNLAKTGVLNLSGENIFDLTPLGSQKKLKKLIISNSQITDITSIPTQPNLISLVANNTFICQILSYSRVRFGSITG